MDKQLDCSLYWNAHNTPLPIWSELRRERRNVRSSIQQLRLESALRRKDCKRWPPFGGPHPIVATIQKDRRLRSSVREGSSGDSRQASGPKGHDRKNSCYKSEADKKPPRDWFREKQISLDEVKEDETNTGFQNHR